MVLLTKTLLINSIFFHENVRTHPERISSLKKSNRIESQSLDAFKETPIHSNAKFFAPVGLLLRASLVFIRSRRHSILSTIKYNHDVFFQQTAAIIALLPCGRKYIRFK